MRTRTGTMMIAAAVAALLWLASGLLHLLTASNVYVGRALRLLVPNPTNALFWTWPMPWSILALLLAATSVAAAVYALSSILRGRGGGSALAPTWLSVVAAGALVGLGIDAIIVLSAVSTAGWRALMLTSVEYAVVGAYWGLVQGWIPALIAAHAAARENADVVARPARGKSVAIAAAALAAFVVVGVVGAGAHQAAIVQQQAIDDPRPAESGAAPDPAAPGSPPAATAASPEERQSSWCTPDEATLLLGSEDAATGHRVLSIRVMNFSDAPCVVDGYPDIVFADQNGNELDVTIARGSSFLAQDAGAQAVEIPPGGYAIAFLGWDANATAGALVATTLFAAQVPGDERGSWPITLDIVSGSTVELTAWQLDEVGPASDGG